MPVYDLSEHNEKVDKKIQKNKVTSTNTDGEDNSRRDKLEVVTTGPISDVITAMLIDAYKKDVIVKAAAESTDNTAYAYLDKPSDEVDDDGNAVVFGNTTKKPIFLYTIDNRTGDSDFLINSMGKIDALTSIPGGIKRVALVDYAGGSSSKLDIVAAALEEIGFTCVYSKRELLSTLRRLK